MEQVLADFDDKDRKLVIDASTAATQAEPVVIIDGKPAVRKGDLVVVVGGKCSGKSNLASLLAAACISPTPIGGSLWIPDGKRIAIFDTGQSDGSISRRSARALNTAGARASLTECGDFTYFTIKDFSAVERMIIIQRVCERLRPDIVYIDGLSALFDVCDGESAEEAMSFLEGYVLAEQRTVFATMFARSYALRMVRDGLMSLAGVVASLTREHRGDSIVFDVTTRDRDHEETSLSFRVVDDGSRYEILKPLTE